ncbi:methyltransferase domain-containing protein [Sphingobium aquiterrae]|uniref:methyltransferase domain-containing protein n=1 Tax=Sphingobium aquiterrae TaxID=2038656 RepID=UPI0030183753
MDTGRKQRIGSAFGAAAAGYEDHAGVQRTVARAVAELAERQAHMAGVAGQRLRVLELGCGTGFLTRDIQAIWPQAELVATDLAPEMVGRTADGAMLAGTFLPMDGEQPWFEGPWFDLILSSLAFQWFDDMARAIDRLVALLRPGGSLIFSTMGARSFAGWRAAHAACGAEAGVPAYPTLGALQAMLVRYPDAFAFDEDYPLDCGSARGLIAHLKGIGAVVPIKGRAPLAPAKLRAVMAAFDAAGARDGYHVLFGRVTRLPD